MHESSRMKFEAFVETYIGTAVDGRARTVLDIGSRQVTEDAYSYRQALEPFGVEYVGLDLEAGYNVNVVPANPFIWAEIEDETFDFIVSGQAFEHNPFMWVTMAEIARVLKPNGVAFIIAPSAGRVHRFPFDCWRYYPDSWAALAAAVQLELAESIREPDDISNRVKGGQWIDSAGIFRKAPFQSDAERDDFYANLALHTAPFKVKRYDIVPAKVNEGPCFGRYVEMTEAGLGLRRVAREGVATMGASGEKKKSRRAKSAKAGGRRGDRANRSDGATGLETSDRQATRGMRVAARQLARQKKVDRALRSQP